MNSNDDSNDGKSPRLADNWLHELEYWGEKESDLSLPAASKIIDCAERNQGRRRNLAVGLASVASILLALVFCYRSNDSSSIHDSQIVHSTEDIDSSKAFESLKQQLSLVRSRLDVIQEKESRLAVVQNLEDINQELLSLHRIAIRNQLIVERTWTPIP